jgi:hypothetical protein
VTILDFLAEAEWSGYEPTRQQRQICTVDARGIT